MNEQRAVRETQALDDLSSQWGRTWIHMIAEESGRTPDAVAFFCESMITLQMVTSAAVALSAARMELAGSDISWG